MRPFLVTSLLASLFTISAKDAVSQNAKLRDEIQNALPAFPIVTWAEIDFIVNPLLEPRTLFLYIIHHHEFIYPFVTNFLWTGMIHRHLLRLVAYFG